MADLPTGARPDQRLRILTWHVHGNYLWYLTQVPHEFWLVTDADRTPHHTGANGTLPWGENVHEAHVDQLHDLEFDLVLYQSRREYERDQYELLSPDQQRLPAIYLEHDPPQESPFEQKHWADDERVTLVHCTHFNALMWRHTDSPVEVIEHGVKLIAPATYEGGTERGIVVVNNLKSRGRRLGLDIYEQLRGQVPLTLVGMNADQVDPGAGEVMNHELPATMAMHRFFFNPIRWTSLGLSIIEAMLVGLPIVGLATTELTTVIRNGENGWVDTRVDKLVEVMRQLLHEPDTARRWGEEARRTAQQRFGIERFAADWDRVFRRVAAQGSR